MPSYLFQVEASSFNELLDKIKKELNILEKDSEEIKVKEECIKRKVRISPRNNKRWTEFELEFLKENYLDKTTTWMAKKLGRKNSTVNQMLFKMYSKGLKKRNNKTKTIKL